MEDDPLFGQFVQGKYFTEALFLDIDEDKEDTFHKFEKYAHFDSFDDPLERTSWKSVDRLYFFNNPGVQTRNRETLVSERAQAIKQAAFLGVDMRKILETAAPFFENVMVINISPGCRARVPIDTLDRKMKDILVFSGWAIPGVSPTFSRLNETLRYVRNIWVTSLNE